MRTFSITFAFIASATFFLSCQKEYNPGDIIPRPTDSITTNDGTLLVKYVEIDSTPGVGTDTSMIINFEYDEQKRLTELNIFRSDDTTTTERTLHKYAYQYNGADTFPYKILYTTIEVNDTSYLFYNTEGKLILDSTFSKHGTSPVRLSKTSYKYFNGYFITNTDEQNSPSSLDSNFVTNSNGNMTSLSAAIYSLPDMLLLYKYNYSFSYDNHPNPFYNIPAMHSTMPVLGYPSSPIGVLQKNNPTYISGNEATFNTTTTETITYTYQPNGYPSAFYSSSLNTLDNTGLRLYKAIFFYSR